MNLEDFGYNNKIEIFRKENNLDRSQIGRVIAEHRERYIVKTINSELEAEVTGNIRFTAKDREDFPAVGDWVTIITYEENYAIINDIMPRSSIIKRKAIGKPGDLQVIAANVDYAFLVQSVDRDFNMNRLERYLTICHSSGILPIIILSKIDLVSEQRLSDISGTIRHRISDVRLIALSNLTKHGYEALSESMEKGKTYCMLGSSGAGKSTLLNNLSGREVMRTGEISDSTGKGKHITSHREMIILKNGGILIDNPGMREVGIADSEGGLEITFNIIDETSLSCRYKDCTHTHEAGCAVIDAVERGFIERASYDNYIKLKKEKDHFESTLAERKKKGKEFGKIVKNYKKTMKKNRSGD